MRGRPVEQIDQSGAESIDRCMYAQLNNYYIRQSIKQSIYVHYSSWIAADELFKYKNNAESAKIESPEGEQKREQEDDGRRRTALEVLRQVEG